MTPSLKETSSPVKPIYFAPPETYFSCFYYKGRFIRRKRSEATLDTVGFLKRMCFRGWTKSPPPKGRIIRRKRSEASLDTVGFLKIDERSEWVSGGLRPP